MPRNSTRCYAYSPYHHVVPGTCAYPSVLFWTDVADDRVDPMHARKMAAALQAATSSPNPNFAARGDARRAMAGVIR